MRQWRWRGWYNWGMKLSFDSRQLRRICQANDVTYLGLFGSRATGEEKKDSDVDLLVEFRKTKSLLEKGKVLVELERLFQKEVDLVSRKNLKPSLKPFVARQLITLYEKK